MAFNVLLDQGLLANIICDQTTPIDNGLCNPVAL